MVTSSQWWHKASSFGLNVEILFFLERIDNDFIIYFLNAIKPRLTLVKRPNHLSIRKINKSSENKNCILSDHCKHVQGPIRICYPLILDKCSKRPRSVISQAHRSRLMHIGYARTIHNCRKEIVCFFYHLFFVRVFIATVTEPVVCHSRPSILVKVFKMYQRVFHKVQKLVYRRKLSTSQPN